MSKFIVIFFGVFTLFIFVKNCHSQMINNDDDLLSILHKVESYRHPHQPPLIENYSKETQKSVEIDHQQCTCTCVSPVQEKNSGKHQESFDDKHQQHTPPGVGGNLVKDFNFPNKEHHQHFLTAPEQQYEHEGNLNDKSNYQPPKFSEHDSTKCEPNSRDRNHEHFLSSVDNFPNNPSNVEHPHSKNPQVPVIKISHSSREPNHNNNFQPHSSVIEKNPSHDRGNSHHEIHQPNFPGIESITVKNKESPNNYNQRHENPAIEQNTKKDDFGYTTVRPTIMKNYNFGDNNRDSTTQSNSCGQGRNCRNNNHHQTTPLFQHTTPKHEDRVVDIPSAPKYTENKDYQEHENPNIENKEHSGNNGQSHERNNADKEKNSKSTGDQQVSLVIKLDVATKERNPNSNGNEHIDRSEPIPTHHKNIAENNQCAPCNAAKIEQSTLRTDDSTTSGPGIWAIIKNQYRHRSVVAITAAKRCAPGEAFSSGQCRTLLAT